jgi:hypothetical protein
MPKRKQSVRADTADAQGEGSYVVIRRLRGTEAYEYSDASAALKDTPSAATYWQMVQCLGRLVVGWNWVDDDGEPLPLPNDDPQVLETLSVDEINAIASATQHLFTNEPETIKN